MRTSHLAATLAVCFFPYLLPVSAGADQWNFPLKINDKNTTIRFEVDSTWHVVEGKTANVGGSIQLADPSDPASVRGEIRVPVSSFDTDNSSRNKKLREVMAAEKYPHVVYSITSANVICNDEATPGSKHCGVMLNGDLTIRGRTRPWSIAATIRSAPDGAALHGEGKLKWPDFGVEDPSIFIAKLDPEVKILVDVHWNPHPPPASSLPPE